MSRVISTYANVAPVLLGNPATFVAATVARLITAWAGIKAKRVNPCAPYYPVPYTGKGPAVVQGFAVPIEHPWPNPWTFQRWTLWDAWDLWCSNARDAVARGTRIGLPILTWQQRARWKYISGGTLWLSSGRPVPSSVAFSRTSVASSGARLLQLVRF